MKKQIETFAVKVLGMTDEEAQSLFKTDEDGNVSLVDNFAELASAKDRERIDRIQADHKEQLTKIHDKGYQKAQKEVMPKFEKEIKEKYGYETDKIGLDLVDDLIQMNKGKGDVKDIKTHPDYIKLERSLQSDFVPKTKYEEITQEFETFKHNMEREQVVSRVKDDARKVFRSLNPILSKDPKKAANQEAKFLSELDQFDFKVQDDGNHVILLNEKRLENENMNPIGFQDFIKAKASDLFDFADQETRGNSGVDSTAGSSSAVLFSDQGDFYKRYKDESDPEKRVKLYDAAVKQGIIKNK